MNILNVGKKTTDIILEQLLQLRSFLLVDGGPLIEQFIAHTRRKYTELDFTKDCFNPIAKMNDRRADDFIADLTVLIPEGAGTLTRKNSNHLIFKTLVQEKPRTLDKLLYKLLPTGPKDTDAKDAAQKIERILLYSVLKHVFLEPQTFSIRGILLARINRAELGDFTSQALAYFLISRYSGQVVIPAFGFYGHKGHLNLIGQNRLIAGVNYLSESDLRDDLLLMDAKIPAKCLYEDAVELAKYNCPHLPGTNEYTAYIQRSIE